MIISNGLYNHLRTLFFRTFRDAESLHNFICLIFSCIYFWLQTKSPTSNTETCAFLYYRQMPSHKKRRLWLHLPKRKFRHQSRNTSFKLESTPSATESESEWEAVDLSSSEVGTQTDIHLSETNIWTFHRIVKYMKFIRQFTCTTSNTYLTFRSVVY